MAVNLKRWVDDWLVRICREHNKEADALAEEDDYSLEENWTDDGFFVV